MGKDPRKGGSRSVHRGSKPPPSPGWGWKIPATLAQKSSFLALRRKVKEEGKKGDGKQEEERTQVEEEEEKKENKKEKKKGGEKGEKEGEEGEKEGEKQEKAEGK